MAEGPTFESILESIATLGWRLFLLSESFDGAYWTCQLRTEDLIINVVTTHGPTPTDALAEALSRARSATYDSHHTIPTVKIDLEAMLGLAKPRSGLGEEIARRLRG